MIYLIIAVIMSSSVSLIMRWSEKHVKNNFAMFLANYITCSAIALTFLLRSGGKLAAGGEGLPFAIGLGCIGGVLYLVSFMFLKFNIGKNGVMLSTVFMKLGVLVPAVIAIVFFREAPTYLQLIGFAAALAAIVIIYFEPNRARKAGEKRSSGSVVSLLLLLLLGGMAESMANIYDKLGNPAMKDLYILCIFGTAALLCVIVLITKRQPIGRKDILFGIMIGVPNYFSTRFLLLALADVPAVVTYPVYNIGAIIIVCAAGILLFKERMSARKWFGFALIAAALVLLNI